MRRLPYDFASFSFTCNFSPLTSFMLLAITHEFIYRRTNTNSRIVKNKFLKTFFYILLNSFLLLHSSYFPLILQLISLFLSLSFLSFTIIQKNDAIFFLYFELKHTYKYLYRSSSSCITSLLLLPYLYFL